MESYFSDAQHFANDTYSDYDGWDEMGGGEYDYASAGIGAEAKASLPFIINIANSTTDDVANVVFLGANSNLFNATNFGNPAAITITMDNGTVTYTEFLESIKSEPFKVGLMYLQSANTSQPFKQLVIAYREHVSPFLGRVIAGTVSGTTISFGSSVILSSSNTGFLSAIYDSTNKKVVITYSDIGNSWYGKALTYSPRTIITNLTSENYIGISDGAYTNGQTATVQIIGAVDDAQSSLTPGQAYYVQDDGTLAESGSVFAGTAVAATKLIVRG